MPPSATLSVNTPASARWHFGPVKVWHLPHSPKTRGEIQARACLAAELGYSAHTLPLSRDQHGRPQLGAALVHWDSNWSHSGDHLLLALAKQVRLGVDLERQRPRRHLRQTIERFFHPDEISWLNQLDDNACETAFFRLWCAKEAVLKAHGQGISFGLHKLCFAPLATNALQLVYCDPALGVPTQWHLRQWQPFNGYHAALAWNKSLPVCST